MDDPDFRPADSYWMGPTWYSYNIYILRALFRRDPKAGWKLFNRFIDTLMPNGIPMIFENYNPITGVGYDSANFGWQGMLVDVVLREVLGITPTQERLVVSKPNCPDSWSEWSIRHLYFQGRYFDLHSKRHERDGWKTQIVGVFGV